MQNIPPTQLAGCFVNYKIFRYGHWQIEEGGDDIIIDHNGNEQEWMHCYYTNAKGKMIAVYILNKQ